MLQVWISLFCYAYINLPINKICFLKYLIGFLICVNVKKDVLNSLEDSTMSLLPSVIVSQSWEDITLCDTVQYVSISDQKKITSETRKQATVIPDDTKFWEAEIPGHSPEQKDSSAEKGKQEDYVDSACWFTWHKMVLISKRIRLEILFLYIVLYKRGLTNRTHKENDCT